MTNDWMRKRTDEKDWMTNDWMRKRRDEEGLDGKEKR